VTVTFNFIDESTVFETRLIFIRYKLYYLLFETRIISIQNACTSTQLFQAQLIFTIPVLVAG
jgi:hypothetical protein